MISMIRLFIVLLLSAPMLAFAGFDHVTDAERAALIRLIHVLDSAKPLIDQAEHNQVSDTRFPLDYTQLREDIELIREGISRHISKPARSPRRLPPLQGEYTYRSR